MAATATKGTGGASGSIFPVTLLVYEFSAPYQSCGDSQRCIRIGTGLTASESLTEWGVRVSKAAGRGDSFEEFHEQGLLVILIFDGIGALRVALESLKVPLAGYVAIEKDGRATRVVASHFPSCTFYSDATKVSSADIRASGAKYPNCCAVLAAGGPPYQGVSGLNATKKGAEEDPRSSLHTVFDCIKQEVRSF